MPVQLIASPVTLPLADRSARAGSPANDFAGKRLDITDLLVTHPKATFLLRVAGPSMQEHGIDDGDIVVVDRELRARDGSIVVALVERELVIRVLEGDGDTCKLRQAPPPTPTSCRRKDRRWKYGVSSPAASSALPDKHMPLTARSAAAWTSSNIAAAPG
jgi:DNA polymerase V